ncbi:MAG: hypothetical protein GF313_09765, partial [Caldithrix sp.]|nr:hypothetical protein [Caldithrix sp.]
MKHIYLFSLCLILLSLNQLYSRISENIHNLPNALKFEDMSEIMPASAIFCFYQDHQGFLWYGSSGDGLVRFDGLQYKIYSQIKSQIRDIVEHKTDQGAIFWIAAYGEGLYKFNPQQETFRHYCHDPSDPASLSCDRTRKLYIHNDGSLWIGTMRGGINILRPDQMNRNNPEFIHVRHDSANHKSLSNDEIKALY